VYAEKGGFLDAQEKDKPGLPEDGPNAPEALTTTG
jgi:hypothetical protein